MDGLRRKVKVGLNDALGRGGGFNVGGRSGRGVGLWARGGRALRGGERQRGEGSHRRECGTGESGHFGESHLLKTKPERREGTPPRNRVPRAQAPVEGQCPGTVGGDGGCDGRGRHRRRRRRWPGRAGGSDTPPTGAVEEEADGLERYRRRVNAWSPDDDGLERFEQKGGPFNGLD